MIFANMCLHRLVVGEGCYHEPMSRSIYFGFFACAAIYSMQEIMTIIAFTLITVSAFLHASWNLIGKRQNPSSAFFCVAVVATAVFLSPLLLFNRPILPLIPRNVWALILLSGAFQTLYLTGLARAYKRGDLSLIYPLVRALPIMMVAAISLSFGTGETISPLGLVGMLLITIGCVVLPLSHFDELRLSNYRNSGALLALIAALGTVGYTLLDDTILWSLRGATATSTTLSTSVSIPQITLLYITLSTCCTAVFMALYVGLIPAERQRLHIIWHNNLRSTILVGMITMLSYGLVLASFNYVTNVSYAAAFRQLSIPIGVLFGFIVQKESFPLPKIVGIIIICSGLLFVIVG